MKKRIPRSPYFWAIVLVATAVLVAWVGRDKYRAAAILAGATAPDFTYPMLGGGEASLHDYRGRVVLVNIWATWCGPCRIEMPSLQRLYERMEGTDFEILAVSVDAPTGQRDESGNPGGNLQDFVDEFGLTFPILHDESGHIGDLYQTTGVPESFVIGKDGVIYKRWPGQDEWDSEANLELVQRLLAR